VTSLAGVAAASVRDREQLDAGIRSVSWFGVPRGHAGLHSTACYGPFLTRDYAVPQRDC